MSAKIRIAAGRLRGRVLAAPTGIRPTSSRVRESLMDIWTPLLVGARFLDLFAGSGAVGIEAFSRGAAAVVLVESDPGVLLQLKENCRVLGVAEARILSANLPADVPRLVSQLPSRFDLVFADPPYAFDEYEELLLAASRLLAPEGELAVEHASRRDLPRGCGEIRRFDHRTYGDTCLSFYRQGEGRTQDCRKKASSSR